MTIEIPDAAIVARFTVMGDPASKARARFTGRGSKARAYTPEKTRTGEARVAWAFRQAAPDHQPDKDSAYGLDCTFYAANYQRRDVDNMLKLVSDGLNGVAWGDDFQVDEVAGRRGSDLPKNARTEVIVYRLGDINRPMKACPVCDGKFRTYPSSRRVYCSPACANTKKDQGRRTCVCEQCGESFRVKQADSRRRFCSEGCRNAAGHVRLLCEVCGDAFDCFRSWQRKHAYCDKDDCRRAIDAKIHRERRTRTFPGTCAICGIGTTRKEYRRCGQCKRANRTVPDQDRLEPLP